MEKRKYIVLLAAMLLVIGAPSLLFAGGGIPTAIKESFRVGEQDCQLNVAFDQLGDSILATSATTLNSEDDGFTCYLDCGEGGECKTFCNRSGGGCIDCRSAAAAAPAGPSWCNNDSIVRTRFDQTVVCEKKDCKPNRKGTYDCTTAYGTGPGKCEFRDSVHRRTAERLGNNTQICVTPRTGPRYCLGTP
jgi:hypothetical protein